MNKKIIHSCTSLSFSGLERYVLELAQWQNQNGQDVLLLCRDESEIYYEATKLKIPTLTIPKNCKKGFESWLYLRKPFSALIKKAESESKKIVIHMHAGGEPMFILPWLLMCSEVIEKVILQFHLWITKKKLNPWHTFLYSRIDDIWCSSLAARDMLNSILPVSKSKFKVIPYGRKVSEIQKLNKEKFRTELRSKYNVPQNAFLYVSVNRIEKIKGTREMYEAFIKRAEQNPNIYLWIIGNASPQNQEAENYEKSLHQDYEKLTANIKSRIHFFGYVSNSLELMAAADVFILPSYEECMSLAMLDSFALSLPVLGTNAGGTPSVVLENKTGWIFEPISVDSLIQKMKSIEESLPQKSNEIQFYINTFATQFEQNKIFEKIVHNYSY